MVVKTVVMDTEVHRLVSFSLSAQRLLYSYLPATFRTYSTRRLEWITMFALHSSALTPTAHPPGVTGITRHEHYRTYNCILELNTNQKKENVFENETQFESGVNNSAVQATLFN